MRLRLALAAVAVASVAASGCGLNQEGIGPPADRIFYPGAITVDPTGRWLYVVNSNADLRFNDGTVVAVDLDVVAKVRADTSGAPICGDTKYINPLTDDQKTRTFCCWDSLDRNILNCDERQFIRQEATVRVGSFGSAIEIQDKTGSSGDHGQQRLLVAVRGNASVTWIDAEALADPVTFSCSSAGSAAGSFGECDLDHRVSKTNDLEGESAVRSSVDITLPEEPYAMAIDRSQQLLYTGHLRNGFLSAIDLSQTPPTLIGPFPGIFPGDVNGSTGVTSLTLTANGINDGRVYATSRFVPSAGAFAPISFGPVSDPPDPQTDNPHIFLANAGDTFVSPLTGSETRGIQPIPLIQRTYLLQRTPPVLIGFATGDPGSPNRPTDIIEMCSGPTFLHMYPPYTPGSQNTDELLFVTCFESGQVYVVDPYAARVLAIVEVGRGPAGLAFPPLNSAKHAGYAYVVGFGSNNVSVIDLIKGSPTQYHVIERIGFPNPVPR